MKHLNWKKIYLILGGFIALCWFIIRVIPKPSRAAYPCQRAAFPIASAFVIWLTSLLSSTLFFLKFKKNLKNNKLAYALLFLFLFGISSLFYFTTAPVNKLFAFNSSEYIKVPWDASIRTKAQTSNIITSFDDVSVVKSSISNATDIDFDEIESMLRESVEQAGGLSTIIANGDYVVLKPNLVEIPPIPSPEYKEVGGIATDWRVVKAVAKMVRELNPDGKIYIIESSSAVSTREVLDYYKYTLDNFPEVDQIVALEDSCGVFEDYGDSNLEKLYLDDNIRLYPDEEKPNLSPEFYINKIYNNADVVISIPVLKNHKVAIITGGVKNVAIGMAPPNIYGISETFFGKWTKIDHGQENLNKWLHDFYMLKPVDFVVIDGLQGFDHGPTGLDELTMEEMQHNMRLIISGKKALSVDAVCSNIMSLDPTYANYMVYLDKEQYGVGTINSKFIRLKGEKMLDIREVFPHNEEVVLNAIYNDYTPPNIEVASTTIDENIVTFYLEYDDDLDKVELKVNGKLLDQIGVDNFHSLSFEIDEDLLPVENLTLIYSDRFFNENEIFLDYSAISENEISQAKLYQNFPNPFLNSTNISFELFNPVQVRLYISDLNGNIIATLVDDKLSAGNHQYKWNGYAKTGTYIYSLEIEGNTISKRMIKK